MAPEKKKSKTDVASVKSALPKTLKSGSTKSVGLDAFSAESRGRRIEVVGEVVSDKMDKTISVLIYRLVRHKKYGKYMRRTSVFKAHDEKNIAKVGDKVKIHETRPLSKTKRWALSEVLESAKA